MAKKKLLHIRFYFYNKLVDGSLYKCLFNDNQHLDDTKYKFVLLNYVKLT